jgi:RNA-binding protein
VNSADRLHRDADIQRIEHESGAELIQRVGHVAVFYRRNAKKPRISVPA